MQRLLTIAGLMASFTTAAWAEDAPPPAVYVPPPVELRVTKAEGRIERLEHTQQQQAEINTRLLDELRALRLEIAAVRKPTAVADVAPSPSAVAYPLGGCSSGSCPSASRAGWYPGKLLGR